MGNWEIREGMTAISSDGERLGKVIGRDGNALVIEKGFFFPKDFLCRLDYIRDVRGDEVILARSKDELERGLEAGGREQQQFEDRGEASAGDVRVPIKEEQLEVQKRSRQAGEVQVRKEVEIEQKHITVPVTRETVRVERVPASASAQADSRFENETVRVPLMEEEVQVTKRPVVKEEVRISKESHTEERGVDETVRRERARIDRGGGELRADAADDDDPLTRR